MINQTLKWYPQNHFVLFSTMQKISSFSGLQLFREDIPLSKKFNQTYSSFSTIKCFSSVFMVDNKSINGHRYIYSGNQGVFLLNRPRPNNLRIATPVEFIPCIINSIKMSFSNCMKTILYVVRKMRYLAILHYFKLQRMDCGEV